jgi:hypothetical protein
LFVASKCTVFSFYALVQPSNLTQLIRSKATTFVKGMVAAVKQPQDRVNNVQAMFAYTFLHGSVMSKIRAGTVNLAVAGNGNLVIGATGPANEKMETVSFSGMKQALYRFGPELAKALVLFIIHLV